MNDLEEERRLAYVAITRAKEVLYMSFVNSRFFRGSRSRLNPSRFLNEAKLLEFDLEDESIFKKGDLIKHKIFGIGRVTSVEGLANEQKLGINFGGIERIIMSNFVEKVV